MNEVFSLLTGRSNVEQIGSFESLKLIDDWKKGFAIDISNELEGIPKIELYKCNETGLRFFVPASAAGSENLYAQLQKFEWFYMPWKWEHEVLFSRLKSGEKILEVGCATGSFIEKLCNAGFDAEGIEFNSAAVAKAQEKNLPVSSKDLSALSHSKSSTFDVVCSFQVLEHVSDPAAFIRGCLTLLKPNGRLVICVPNNESFLKYQYNLLDMPPHHMTQWSAETFRSLEKFYPLRLSYVKYEPLAEYHIDGYLYAHRQRLRTVASGFLRLFLNYYSIPFIRFALKSGLRHFCRGQSIYVELVKL
jgi:SAM-dependent methyltransferase